MIPKQIFQTFSCEAELPDWYFANRDRIIALNPGWDYKIYFDDECEDFISTHYGADVLRAYRQIDPRYGAARADFFRYLLLYRRGGVYLDLKSGLTRPLDEVLAPDEEFIVSRWDEAHFFNGWGKNPEVFPRYRQGEICQWFIISRAGHPFLKSVIDLCLENIGNYRYDVDGYGQRGVLRMTGPVAFTLGVERARGSAPCTEKAYAAYGLVYSIFENAAAFASGGDTGSARHMGKNNYRNHAFPVILNPGTSAIAEADFPQYQAKFRAHEAERAALRRRQLWLRPQAGLDELRLYLSGNWPRYFARLDPRRRLSVRN